MSSKKYILFIFLQIILVVSIVRDFKMVEISYNTVELSGAKY